MKKYTLPVSLITLLFLASCGNTPATPASGSQDTVLSLKVVPLNKEDITLYKTYSTNIEGRQNVEIRPKISGFIKDIYVEEGQQVKKGQTLFKLETQTLSQNANAALAAVNVAQVEVNKLVPLVEKGIIGNVQLETAKAQLQQAKSHYQSIISDIDYSKITSPVDGFIGALPYRTGTLVSATIDKPLTVVSDISEVRAYFSYNEKEFLEMKQHLLAQGKTVTPENLPEVGLIMVNGEEYPDKGKIGMVNNMINAATGSVAMRADFKNPNQLLSNGSTGELKIPYAHTGVYMIPQSATVDVQGNKLIYVLREDNTVTSETIKISGATDKYFIVKESPKHGSTLVIEGVSKLRDGMAINPLN